jgi:phosphatidylglycerophosphate synthase
VTLKVLWDTLFGRRFLDKPHSDREKILTFANGLTAFRACAAGALLVVAIASNSHSLLLVGLGVSMLFDFVDGHVARLGSGVTVLGAQLDGHADRLAALLVVVGVVVLEGDTMTVVGAVVVWVQFGVLDAFLAGQFLRFQLWSPDHFHRIDENVWLQNWSAGAKFASNVTILLLAIGGSAIVGALALSTALIAMRLASYRGIRDEAKRLTLDEGRRDPLPRPAPLPQSATTPTSAPSRGLWLGSRSRVAREWGRGQRRRPDHEREGEQAKG